MTFDGTFAYDNRQRASNGVRDQGLSHDDDVERRRTSATSQLGNVGDEAFNGNLTATFRKQLHE